VARATVHVEKPGQRKILVGAGGTKIRQIGIGARQRLEALLGTQVHLELYVRVTPRWKDVPRQLAELGYESTEATSPARSAARTHRARLARRRQA
jgi:GTP-binding protein Era